MSATIQILDLMVAKWFMNVYGEVQLRLMVISYMYYL